MIKWILAVVAVLVVGGAAVAYFVGDGGKATAEIACEDLVKDRLKAPSSAVFDHQSEKRDGNRWMIEGAVESNNEAGVKVASDYTCSIRLSGDQWTGRATVAAR